MIQAAGPVGVASVTSGAIAVTPAAAAKLMVTTTTPSVIAAGKPFGFAVTAEDIYDNPVTSYGDTVTVTISGDPAGGARRHAHGDGRQQQRSFTGLSLTKTGTTRLVASAAGLTACDLGRRPSHVRRVGRTSGAVALRNAPDVLRRPWCG